jgi:hypothetical protein
VAVVELRRWYRIAQAPSGPFFEALLDFAAARKGHYPSFSLVQRGGQKPSGAAAELLEALAPFLITTTGTGRLPEAPARGAPEGEKGTGRAPQSGSFASASERLHFYRLERGSAVLLGRVGSLAAFVPPLPEELSVLAADKSPWLQSDAKAQRFRLLLSADESKAMAKALPWLVLEPEP